ncbi:hypothetical protein PAERUG_P54_1_London_24_VIM_2_04_13_05469 [Pseudomonas aeruginosa]|nr:hypothetical protein PAERUG_P54_1_London_24_VIM_2_04_13_05469 [Pseudomonas aeruginosa]
MAALAVQRAVEAIQGVGQRYEAGRHVGQGIGLLTGPGVQGLAGRLGIVGQAGAAQLVEQAAAARAVGRGADHRRQLAGAPPEAEAEQGGQGQHGGSQLPGPERRLQAFAERQRRRRRLRLGLRRGGHFQGARWQAGALQAVFAGVPPDHFERRQLDAPGLLGHQRLALLATADEALVGALVGQLRLVRVAPQALHVGQRQRRKLGAGKPLDLQQHVARQRFADLRLFRLRAPAFADAQRAGRHPGRVGRIVGGLGPDLQRDARRSHPHLPAGARAEGVVVVAATVDQGRTEGLRRNLQGAALLREDRVAHLDHAVADAVDLLLVGARLAELFDLRVVHRQRGQAAVVV